MPYSMSNVYFIYVYVYIHMHDLYDIWSTHVCFPKMSCKPEPENRRLLIKTDMFIATTHDNANKTYIFLTIH